MHQPHDQMRFSIIVPAYNEAAYLGRALDSLLHQDYDGEYEVIVVDNNSTRRYCGHRGPVRRAGGQGASAGGMRGPAARG